MVTMKRRPAAAGCPMVLAVVAVLVGCAGEREQAAAPDAPPEAAQPPTGLDAPPRVAVEMGEYWFRPGETELVAGVPYRFVLRNAGTEHHEWAVVPRGDRDESRMLTEVEEDELPPGAEVEHQFTFEEPGEFDMACFLPGHYEAGMVHPVTVRAQ